MEATQLLNGVVIVLLAVNNSDYTVTVQTLCSHCAQLVGDAWSKSFAVIIYTTKEALLDTQFVEAKEKVKTSKKAEEKRNINSLRN